MKQLDPNRMYPHLHESFLLSRRAFLRTLAIAGSGTALSSLLANCAAPPTTGTAQSGAAPAAANPKVGGTYRMYGRGDFRTLDPPGAESSEDWWSAGMVLFNMLYFYTKEGEFYADLAADLPKISANGLVYTIPIRKNVKFHSGRELVAEDVKYSLERQLWPEVYSWGKTYMENVVGYNEVIKGPTKELSGIKIIDDHTLEITLKKPQAVFPAILSMSMNGIIPKKESIDAGSKWGSEIVIGTGPFRFVQWVAGEKAVYERNPDYYKSGMPFIDKIELNLNVDPATQMLHYENGEAEWVENIPAAELPRLLSDPALSKQLRRAPSLTTNRLGFHFKVKPLADLKVRQAVAMAIDKEGLAKKRSGTLIPLEGYYTIPMLQYDKAFKSKYPYAPEKAKALLKEAGYADGIKGLKMYVGQDAEIGQLLQADLAKIGIETELAVGEWKDWRDRIRAGDVAFFVYGWSASFPDAFDFTSAWTTCASADTGYNDGFYCNQKIDDTVAKVEALALTAPERVKGYHEIEDIVINQDVAWVGLNTPQRLGLGASNVQDDFISPIYGWPYLETAWIETKS